MMYPHVAAERFEERVIELPRAMLVMAANQEERRQCIPLRPSHVKQRRHFLARVPGALIAAGIGADHGIPKLQCAAEAADGFVEALVSPGMALVSGPCKRRGVERRVPYIESTAVGDVYRT